MLDCVNVPEYPRISPAPNWTSIFTLRPDLEAPGYAETLIDIAEKPYVNPDVAKREKAEEKKKKKKLGRGQKA